LIIKEFIVIIVDLLYIMWVIDIAF